MLFFPDYVKAMDISTDDVQFACVDKSGVLLFNLLTHETWIEDGPSTLEENNSHNLQHAIDSVAPSISSNEPHLAMNKVVTEPPYAD